MVLDDIKPEYKCGIAQQDIHLERTLAIFKPDVLEKGVEQEIEDIILNNGFTILDKKRILMTPEQTSNFYSEHYGKLFFASLVAYMSSGPSVVMVLAKTNAVQVWRDLIGPTNTIKARNTHPECLRAIYGCDETRNGFHGSDSLYSADREICFFFNNSIVEPIPSGINARDYLSKCINPTLLMGLTSLCKRKPINPIVDWLSDNNPNKPDILPSVEIPVVPVSDEKTDSTLGENKYSYDPEKMATQEFGLTAEERLVMIREQRQQKEEEDLLQNTAITPVTATATIAEHADPGTAASPGISGDAVDMTVPVDLEQTIIASSSEELVQSNIVSAEKEAELKTYVEEDATELSAKPETPVNPEVVDQVNDSAPVAEITEDEIKQMDDAQPEIKAEAPTESDTVKQPDVSGEDKIEEDEIVPTDEPLTTRAAT